MTRELKKGKAVKLSPQLVSWIERKKRRPGRPNEESYDSVLRRFLGLPDRRGKGRRQELKTFFIVPNEGQPMVFLEEAEARGAAIMLAVRKKREKPEAAIEVREVR